MTTATTTRAGRGSRSRARRLLLVPAACALVLGTAACGGTSGTSAAGTSSGSSGSSGSMSSGSMSSGSMSSTGSSGMAATDTVIMIEKFAYKTPQSVSPGATVGVMNMDGTAHTVTADSGNAFDVKAPPGKTVTFTAPSTPGTYAFHCTYHSNMHGVLVVK